MRDLYLLLSRGAMVSIGNETEELLLFLYIYFLVRPTRALFLLYAVRGLFSLYMQADTECLYWSLEY